MNTKTLGLLALIGAPFLLVDNLNNDLSIEKHSQLSGIFNLVYMTGWLLAVVALRRLGAFGRGKFGNVLFIVQVAFLALGECWNVYETVQPGAGTKLYFFLDMFWPLSNLCMFVTGITVAVKGQLKGWFRYAPLAVGCWLPIGLVLWAVFSRTPGMLLFAGLYSALTWGAMAIGIIRQADELPGGAAPASGVRNADRFYRANNKATAGSL